MTDAPAAPPPKEPPPGLAGARPALLHGVDWRRAGLAALLVAAGALALDRLVWGGGEGGGPAPPARDAVPPAPRPPPGPTYQGLAAPPAREVALAVPPAPAPAAPPRPEPAPAAGGGAPRETARDRLRAALLTARMGSVEPDTGKLAEAMAARAGEARRDALGRPYAEGDFRPPGGSCQVNAGTVLPVRLETAVLSAEAGPVVARVTRDVLDSMGGGCLAIPAGSVLVGRSARTDVRGERRARVVFTSLTRPWPKGDTLDVEEAASDPTGRAALPGQVDSHLAERAALVGLATLVDAATVGLGAVTGGVGGAIAGGLAANAESPLDRAAREQLDRPAVIDVDPARGEGAAAVVLTRHVQASDFRH